MFVNSKDKKIDKKIGLDRALVHVQREIARAEGRLRCLRNSAKIIRSKVEAGEAWPGTQSESQDSKQQHSV